MLLHTTKKMCTLHCSKDPTPLKLFFFIKSAYKDTFCNMKCDSYNNLMFSMQTCCPKENTKKKVTVKAAQSGITQVSFDTLAVREK